MSQRQLKLESMQEMREVEIASIGEIHRLIEAHRLYSRGIGFVDVHLLASCLLTPGTRLWTRDLRLSSVAHALHCAAALPPG